MHVSIVGNEIALLRWGVMYSGSIGSLERFLDDSCRYEYMSVSNISMGVHYIIK